MEIKVYGCWVARLDSQCPFGIGDGDMCSLDDNVDEGGRTWCAYCGENPVR
jgi:hypothetical protein